jgi:antibiotic biosynthesis monooxygenase (ABM) superfamily enzyme
MKLDELSTAEASAVTSVVDRVPRPGQGAALEAAIHELIAAALAFPGHMGATVARPSLPSQPGFRIVYRFDSGPHLKAWLDSGEYARLAELADRYTLGPPTQEILVGLETWFTPAGGTTPPSRERMAVVSWLGIFPLAWAANTLGARFFPDAPSWARAAVGAALVVLGMTYVVGPRLTKLFRPWLFPEPQKRGQEPPQA